MKKGGIVVTLFIAGVVLIIGAIFIYSRAEDNSFARLLSTIQETKGDSKKANDQCVDLTEKLTTLQAILSQLQKGIQDLQENQSAQFEHVIEVNRQSLKKVHDDVEILKVRQHTLEKKIISRDRTVNLNLGPRPLEVEIISTSGTKAKSPLLKRSGVLNEN